MMGRRRVMLTATLGMIGGILAVHLTEQTARADRPASVPTLRFWVRNGWLRFDVVDGRIVAAANRQPNATLLPDHANGVEQLRLETVGGRAKLLYRRDTSKETLNLEFTLGGPCLIRRQGLGDDSPIVSMTFHQNSDGETELVLGRGESADTYRSAGLWPLLICHPKPCQEHLLPVLELFDPDWQLGKTAQSIERELLNMAQGHESSEYRRIAQLVDKLNDDRFGVRTAADRQLRAAGQMALSYLKQLDFRQLRPEQQFRIRRILYRLGQQSDNDTPKTRASHLLGDPQVWLALLSRPQMATRQVAAKQLAVLLDSAVNVDPVAAPATQKAAMEALGRRIAESVDSVD